jgi:DNA primase
MDCAGSDKRYGFNMAFSQSERLYIFESAIDSMSHASLDKSAWQQHNRLSLAGTSDTAIPFFLNQHPYTKDLIFCLDNDPAGREAAAVMTKKYADKGYCTRIELPAGKDFNEDLTAYRAAVHNDKFKTRGEFNDR